MLAASLSTFYFCSPAVEFPAVLLNTSTGEVESEFHTYVQPQERPILSEFCSELTGITQVSVHRRNHSSSETDAAFSFYITSFSSQGQVEAGVPLHICLSRFSRWLQKLQLEMGAVFPKKQEMDSAASASQKLCTFLTWSGKSWLLFFCFFSFHLSVNCQHCHKFLLVKHISIITIKFKEFKKGKIE